MLSSKAVHDSRRDPLRRTWTEPFRRRVPCCRAEPAIRGDRRVRAVVVRLVLEATQQPQCAAGRHLLDRQADRGEPGPPPGEAGLVPEPDHGQLAGHLHALRGQLLQNAQGELDRSQHECGGSGRLPQQPTHRLAPVAHGRRRPQLGASGVVRKAALLKGGAEAAQTFRTRGQFLGAAQVGDAGVSQRHEVGRGPVQRLAVVHTEPLGAERGVAAQQLQVRYGAQEFDGLAVRARGGHDDDAGHAVRGQFPQMAQLHHPVVVGLREHQLEALGRHVLGELVRDGRVEAVADVRDHQRDHVAGRSAHHPRGPVADVAHLGSGLADPELGLLADARVVGECPADRRDGDPETFGDVPGRDHVSVPSG